VVNPEVTEILALMALRKASLGPVDVDFNYKTRKGGQITESLWLLTGARGSVVG
jgi:hypothetical protein